MNAEFLAAKDPSGPPPVSLWQLLRGARSDPLQRWTQLREQHGDVARYRYGLDDIHFISHPDGARRVLQDNVANYSKQHPTYGMLKRLLGEGLLTSEGSFWLRQRRLAQPAFHRQRIAAMAGQMVAAAGETAEAWARQPPGESFSMFEEMSKLTLKIVGDALFGKHLGDRGPRVSAAWDFLNKQMVERVNNQRFLPPILPTRYDAAFRSARRTLFGLVDEIVAASRGAQGTSDDLLSMLMSARDEDTGEQMSDAQLRNEVVTMVLAGHETTSVALSWTWGLLDRHPAARAKLDAELTQVLGGRPPAADDFPKLRFARAVIDEAMRLFPPVYILFRRVLADDVVCGYRVRKGGVVVIAPMALHRNPRFWPNAETFDPDRWADEAEEKRRPRFAYMPFSGGPRQCIGNSFAVMESVLILSTLAQRFKPRAVEGYMLAPEYLVTLRPVGGLPMQLGP
jgi:cytochrome P450